MTDFLTGSQALQSLQSAFLAVPAWNWLLQGVGVLTAYVGAELIAHMRIRGYYLWVVSNLALGTLHAITGFWLLLVMDLLFLKLSIRGILRWARQFPDQAPGWLRQAPAAPEG